ncbi:MAG: hypothetical protein IPK00_10150 [Deltaproteobacteria bacterium]|nr:hypothetical protein [Deltaproteobacteria bacterium]
MSPLTLRNFAGQCGFVPPPWIGEAIASQRTFSRNYVNAMNLDSDTRRKARRFIRLIDGGVSDNLGVRGPFESTLLQRAPSEVEREELGPLRHMVLVLVNAATAPEVEWEAIDAAPALFDIIDQTTTVQINRYTLETIELLRATFESWQEVAATFSEPVGFHLVEVDFTKPADPAERLYLNSLPTSFRLDDEAVDRLRAAGRDSLEADPEFRALVESLGGRSRPVGAE